MDSQTPTRMPIVREEDILLLATILEGKRRHRFSPTYSFSVTITENNRRDRSAKSPRPHGHYLTVVASLFTGGGGGIRTPETLSSLTVFKTAGFNRSPTPPPPILTCPSPDFPRLCANQRSSATPRQSRPLARHSDLANQPAFRRFGVAHQQQHQNHTRERNQPGQDHQRIEQVRAGGDSRIRDVASQLENQDRSDGRSRSAEAAHRSYRLALEQVRRQHIGDGREARVEKCGEPKQKRQQAQVYREHRGNQQRHPDSAQNHQRFSRFPHRPAALDEIPRRHPAEKIAQIRGDERNPHRDQPALQRDAFGHQINREPIRDKEKDRIGEGSRNNRAPGLRKLQQIAPSRPRASFISAVLRIRENHLPLGFADPRVLPRRVIEAAPSDQPEKPEQPWRDERRRQSPSRVQRQHNERRDGPADRGSAVKQRRRQPALVFGKPFRNRFRRARPIPRFPRAEKKPKAQKTVKASRQRRQNRNDRIPQNRKRQPAFGSDAVHQSSAQCLTNGIRHAKRHHAVGVIGVRPVKILLETRSQQRKRLPVNIIDDRGRKQNSANPPAQRRDGAPSVEIRMRRAGARGSLHYRVDADKGSAAIGHADAASFDNVAGFSKADDCLSK